MAVESNNDDHIDEIAEEHGCINVANEQSLLQLTIKLDDWFHKVRITLKKERNTKINATDKRSNLQEELDFVDHHALLVIDSECLHLLPYIKYKSVQYYSIHDSYFPICEWMNEFLLLYSGQF